VFVTGRHARIRDETVSACVNCLASYHFVRS